jgi:hypothetical protein
VNVAVPHVGVGVNEVQAGGGKIVLTVLPPGEKTILLELKHAKFAILGHAAEFVSPSGRM